MGTYAAYIDTNDIIADNDQTEKVSTTTTTSYVLQWSANKSRNLDRGISMTMFSMKDPKQNKLIKKIPKLDLMGSVGTTSTNFN